MGRAITADSVPGRMSPERVRAWLADENVAQTALLVSMFAVLVAAWWFPWNLFLSTPVVDITPLEITVAFAAVVILATRPWRLVTRDEVPWIALLLTYLVWFTAAALLRTSLVDVKPAIAFLAFAGIPAALAFGAVGLDRERGARWVIAFMGGALVLALVGAAVERATFAPGGPDPLAGFWALFRPQASYFHPRIGYMPPPPLHFPIADGVRATSFFVHTNYLAFFGILVTPLVTAGVVRSLRDRRYAVTGLFLVGLAYSVVVTYWTYSRAGLAGLVLGVLVTVALELVWHLRSNRRWRPDAGALRPAILAVGTLGLVLGFTLAGDNLGLRRLTGTDVSDPLVEGGVEASALRSAQLRFRLQEVAVSLVADSPRDAAIGPGLAAYETAVHDPQSPTQIAGATGIRDPNSIWITVALGGGIVGVVLLASVLAAMWSRVVHELRAPPGRWTAIALLWLASWIPVWGLVQFAGTNPFTPAEAMIFGTMMGLSIGLSRRSRARE